MSGHGEDRKGGSRGIYKAVSSGFHKGETFGCQGNWYNQGQPKMADQCAKEGALGKAVE